MRRRPRQSSFDERYYKVLKVLQDNPRGIKISKAMEATGIAQRTMLDNYLIRLECNGIMVAQEDNGLIFVPDFREAYEASFLPPAPQDPDRTRGKLLNARTYM